MRCIILHFIAAVFFLMPATLVMGQSLAAGAGVIDTSKKGPQSYALVLGISNYRFIRPLSYADADAELFKDFLHSAGGGSINDENIFMLLNENAKAANFWVKGMNWLKTRNLKAGDRLYIYLAGHGDAINEDEYFFLTYDCNPAGDKNNYIITGSIQLYNLKSRIAELSRKGIDVILIMDACRSNELPGGSDGQTILGSAISEKRAGETIMLATGAGEESLEDANIGTGHGLFTYYLVDGLSGAADSIGSRDGIITLIELKNYLDRNVPVIAMQKYKRKQDPFICCPGSEKKEMAIVDSAYYRKWNYIKNLKTKLNDADMPQQFRGVKGRGAVILNVSDTSVADLYNNFNRAVKMGNLYGNDSAADRVLERMQQLYPDHLLTNEAKQSLSVEYINLAQSKINLYLECKDVTAIQKIRSQLDETGRTEEIKGSLDRIERIAQLEFYKVGQLLEKVINLLPDEEQNFKKSLQAKLYFFKARGYYGEGQRHTDLRKALYYANTAWSIEPGAAYILNTLSSLYYDNNQLDSAVYFARKATTVAPKWRYPYVNLAYAFGKQNNKDSALFYYYKAIKLDPTNADSYVDIGHYLYDINQKASAKSYYQIAASLNTQNVYANNNLGWLYKEEKKFDSALYFFKKSIEVDSGFINAYNGLGRVYFDIRKYDSAIVYYQKAFQYYPDKSIIYVYMAGLYKMIRQYDSAKEYYRKALELDPLYDDAYINLGKLYVDKNQLDSAKYCFRQALTINPQSAIALLNLGQVFKEEKNKDSVDFYFQQALSLDTTSAANFIYMGNVYREMKRYDKAAEYLKNGIRLNPNNYSGYTNLAAVYKEQKLYDSAQYNFKQALQLDPANTAALNEIGLLFYEQRQFDSARIYYQKVSAIDPSNPAAFNNLGYLFYEQKRYDSAQHYYQKAIAVEPGYYLAYFNLGLSYAAQRKYEPAITAYRSSIQLKPRFTQAYYNLAVLLRETDKIDSALYYYRQLINLQPDFPAAYNNLGKLFYEARQQDSALFYYEKALEISPDYTIALVNIGTLYNDWKEYDSAIVYFKKAIVSNPNYVLSYLNLGMLYHNIQQFDSAAVYLEKAITFNKSAAVYYLLAASYSRAGKIKEAFTALEMALSKGYKDKENIAIDPDFDNLRKLPQFAELVKKYFPDK